MCLGDYNFCYPSFIMDNCRYTEDLYTFSIVGVDKSLDNVEVLMMSFLIKYFSQDGVLCISIFDIP